MATLCIFRRGGACTFEFKEYDIRILIPAEVMLPGRGYAKPAKNT